ncbi:MAG: hypothetical protein MJY67_03990 [Bacteroidales bacterium]|nr:hypothetical protein [Bacteroidales bacterium]
MMSGKDKYPGVMAEYSYCFRLIDKPVRAGGGWDMYLGPGVMAGYVNDIKHRKGATVGLKLDWGVRYRSVNGVSVGVALSPSYAMLLHRSDMEVLALSTYNGTILRSLTPRFTLGYELGRNGYGEKASDEVSLPKQSLITASIEYDYVCGAFYKEHYSYTTNEDGLRIDRQNIGFRYTSNAQLLAYLNFNICKYFSLSVASGYEGMALSRSRAIPLLLKGTVYFSGDLSKQVLPFVFAEAGPAFCIDRKLSPVCVQSRVSSGAKIRMSRNLSLDLNAGIQVQYAHPLNVPGESEVAIKRSNYLHGAMVFGLAISL